MIIGAHAIIYSKDPDADRAFLQDVLTLDGVDAGGGWRIFGLPPAEVAVHPGKKNDMQELYLMCDDVQVFIEKMKEYDIACGPVHEQQWGLLTEVELPGGGKLGVYEPRHPRPEPAKPARAAKRAKPAAARGKATTKKVAKVAASKPKAKPAKATKKKR